MDIEAKFHSDENEVKLAYFFLDRFQMWPRRGGLEDQDEALMDDIMLMDRQVNYRKWSKAHGLIEDEDLEEMGPRAADYKGAF